MTDKKALFQMMQLALLQQMTEMEQSKLEIREMEEKLGCEKDREEEEEEDAEFDHLENLVLGIVKGLDQTQKGKRRTVGTCQTDRSTDHKRSRKAE